MFRRVTPEKFHEELPPHRRPRWKAVLFGSCVSVVVLLVLFSFLGFASFFGSFAELGSSPEIEEQVISGDDPSEKIVVLKLHGVIDLASSVSGSGDGLISPEFVEESLVKAAADAAVKAVVLDIDSPGGGVVASRKIYDALKAFEKPVVAAYTGDLAASGGVYISMAADRITSHPYTITGSIGVITEFVDLSELFAKYGIKFTVVKTGKFKDLGNPGRPLSTEEQAMIASILDEAYQGFVAVIADSRKLSEERVREIADGRVYSGSQAKALGLVDELGDRSRAEDLAEELAGISGAQIVEYHQDDPLASLLGLLQSKTDSLRLALDLITNQAALPSWRLAYRLD